MRQIAWGLLLAGVVATPASADERAAGPSLSTLIREQAQTMRPTFLRTTTQAAPAEPETKKVTVTGALDFPTLYLFRGIRQEADPKLTFQPFVNVAVAASDKATVNVGSWNSIHTGSTKDGYGAFYESDIYGSVAMTPGGKVNPTILYTAYTSPADAFKTVHELAFIAAFDDSGSSVPMAPTVTAAFELGENSADGGANKGIYLELGVTPAIPMESSPVSLTVPVKLGLSLKDYYEGADGDSKFGYVSVGVMATGKISPNLDLHGGVLVYGFGDTLKAANKDKATQVIGTVGLGFTF
ncbi:MAG: hypothetical protein IT184_09265 [Acidobacteria bacterium]|nr:hypothetical protein [Acidobacteriota bacterium]